MQAHPANAPFRASYAALEVQCLSGQSTVTSAFASEPIKLLTPRARGPSVWAFTSSFGGGLVAGDETQLDLNLGPNARCFLGTQASTKVYRNPASLPCGHRTQAFLADDALLVFAPDPVQLFADAAYTQRQSFHLAPTASLVLVDWLTCGRAARGERWAFTAYSSRNEVSMGAGAPSDLVYLDAMHLDTGDDDFTSRHRSGRFHCFATVLMLGPLVSGLAGQWLHETSAQPIRRGPACLFSASPIREGVLWRAAGEDMEAVGQEMRRHLGQLSSLLGDEPWSRKW